MPGFPDNDPVTPQDEYQASLSTLRGHIHQGFRPAVLAYVRAVETGADSAEMATLAGVASDAAAKVENAWSLCFGKRLEDVPKGTFVNEAMGAMEVMSDLWADLELAHARRAIAGDVPVERPPAYSPRAH